MGKFEIQREKLNIISSSGFDSVGQVQQFRLAEPTIDLCEKLHEIWVFFEIVVSEKIIIFIFRSICNIQEKLFIQYGRFFQNKIANSFYLKINKR